MLSQDCVPSDMSHLTHVGTDLTSWLVHAGGPAQSASQMLKAMRLDRAPGGMPKGTKGQAERQQQPIVGRGGCFSRLNEQQAQARCQLLVKCIIAWSLLGFLIFAISDVSI